LVLLTIGTICFRTTISQGKRKVNTAEHHWKKLPCHPVLENLTETYHIW